MITSRVIIQYLDDFWTPVHQVLIDLSWKPIIVVSSIKSDNHLAAQKNARKYAREMGASFDAYA